MPFPEYGAFDAVGLADLMRRGEVAVHEVHEAARSAFAANRQLNAVVEGPFARPLEHRGDGAFGHVPFALKDLVARAAGVPVHNGSRIVDGGTVFDSDSILVHRFRSAGLALLATTTSSEFGIGGHTETLLTGATRNPWDAERSAGGSSGGSAALVAAAVVPFAHANDGAGSIRIPASYCGLIGHKPSRALVPIGPDVQESTFGLTAEFAVTRSARDTALLLDAVAGFAPGEKFRTTIPEGGFARAAKKEPPRSTRIAFTTSIGSPASLNPAVAAGVRRLAGDLEATGFLVEEAQPRVDFDEFVDALLVLWAVGAHNSIRRLLGNTGPLPEKSIEATTRTLALHAEGLGFLDLDRALRSVNRISREMGRFHQRYDLFLTPTTVSVAPLLGEVDADDPTITARAWVVKCLEFAPWCGLYNASGGPAVSLPVYTAAGLPFGLHLGADIGQDDLLVGMTALLEDSHGWNRPLSGSASNHPNE